MSEISFAPPQTPHALAPLLPLTRALTGAREKEITEVIEQLERQGGGRLDASVVTALDSGGLATLCAGVERLSKAGKPVALHAPSAAVRDARIALRLQAALPLDSEEPPQRFAEVGQRLGEVLQQLDYVNEEQIEQALMLTKDDPETHLGQALVQNGALTEEQLTEGLAMQYGMPYVAPVSHHALDVGLDPEIPFNILRVNGLLPFLQHGETLAVAVRDPSNAYATDTFRAQSGRIVLTSVASPTEIEKGLDLLQRAIAARGQGGGAVVERSSASVEELLDEILLNALIEGSSDLHLEPNETSSVLRYRVDGRLRVAKVLSREDGSSLVARIKVMSGCDISEKRLPQDGRLHFQNGERDVDLRVSTLPTVHGEKAVLRVLDRKSLQISMEDLGLEGQNLQWLRTASKLPHGLILVTGPTGSGKTTTLYSVLDEIVTPEVNVSTVENPVERAVKGVNQTQVNHKAGLNFAQCLRALLRQDPDVIMIGEIRDKETATIAVEAALTGHLVLATLHTNDAPGAATRLIQMGVEPFLVAATLRVVMAQRLVRKLCETCKYETSIPHEIREKFSELGLSTGPHFTTSGCPSCRQQGYEGRLGIYEVMQANEAMRDLIARNPSTIEIQQLASESGMTTLMHDAIRYVNQGRTTLEEAIRAGGSL